MEYSKIKNLFEYNPKTGDLKYSQQWSNPKKRGKAVNRAVYFGKERISPLQIAWILMTKQNPLYKLKLVDKRKGLKWGNIAKTGQTLETVQFTPAQQMIHSLLLKGFNQRHLEHLSL